MKTLIILMLVVSLGACKKSETSGPSQNNPPPNNPEPEPPKPPVRPDPPQINAITSGPKTYKSGDRVEFVVTFSQSVTVSEGHSPFLSLTVGDQPRQANFERGENGREGSHLFFIYEVEEGDNDDDGMTLASDEINLNGASIKDSSSQDLVNTIPQESHNFPEVKVEAILPIMEGIAKASGVGSFVGENDRVDLVVTFSEPVKVTGNPSLILEVTGPSAASAVYPNTGGSPTYSPTHTFRYTVSPGQEGSVRVTSLTWDASHFISDEAGNKMNGSLQAPFLVGELTVASGDCVGTDTDADTGFNGGDGSSTNSPYLICTYAQLNKMRDNLTAHYKLGQNINANDSWSAGADGCTAYDGSTVPTTDACRGWVPVGSDKANKCDGDTDDVCFQGHLDGADYVISNLYIHISSSGKRYAGLFGATGNDAEISNIGLTNISMTVTSTNLASYGGGLVGYNQGTISNSYATGGVKSSSLATNTYGSYSYGGGLVGDNFNGGTINNSYATVTVESSTVYKSYAGGLVGSNSGESPYWKGGTISNSYATGEVRASSSSATSTQPISYSGGLVGLSDGTISNSYATGEVRASSSATSYDSKSYGGGLVGFNSGTISNSYAVGGDVSSASSSGSSSSTNNSSNSYVGGFVGVNSGTISDSYATREVESSSSAAFSANQKPSYSYGGGFVGVNSGTLSNSYTTGTVSSTSNGGTTRSGGLVGNNDNNGSISGTHYFVDNSGTNGISHGSCSGTCTQKTLTQLQALISTDVTDWSADNWDFGTTTQLPRVKYATTATYCSDNTYTTQQTCEDASESWVIEGCDGDTGVTCGDVILGQ